jgi:hypothetical protein
VESQSPLLWRFEAVHRRAAALRYLATNAIVRLYSDLHPIARGLRMAGRHARNRLLPFKKLVFSSLTDFDPSRVIGKSS